MVRHILEGGVGDRRRSFESVSSRRQRLSLVCITPFLIQTAKRINIKILFVVNINIMNNADNLFKKLPYELVNIICEYDGRIKFKYKQKNHIDYHKFVNVIHKYDKRYTIITPIIDKKQKIMKNTVTGRNYTCFYFEFAFDNQPHLMLSYEYNYYFNNDFEICYYDMRGAGVRGLGRVLGYTRIKFVYK